MMKLGKKHINKKFSFMNIKYFLFYSIVTISGKVINIVSKPILFVTKM